MVSVLDEVQLADAVDVDRGQRLAAAHRGGDALPARADSPGGGAELAVEVARAVDGSDDRVERDHLQPELALTRTPERRYDLLERQDHVDVARLAAQAVRDARQGSPASHPKEVVLGVGGVQAGAGHGLCRRVGVLLHRDERVVSGRVEVEHLVHAGHLEDTEDGQLP
jgi:hypothetical protein